MVERELIVEAEELFRAAEDVVWAKEQARATQAEVARFAVRGRPKAVGSIEEWLDYQREATRFKDLRAEANAKSRGAEEAERELVRTWLKLLPGEVWFKYGDKAVGLAYSDWGGGHCSVEVTPWCDNPTALPSLDRRYRGG